jgi:hypothetical protein
VLDRLGHHAGLQRRHRLSGAAPVEGRALVVTEVRHRNRRLAIPGLEPVDVAPASVGIAGVVGMHARSTRSDWSSAGSPPANAGDPSWIVVAHAVVIGARAEQGLAALFAAGRHLAGRDRRGSSRFRPRKAPYAVLDACNRARLDRLLAAAVDQQQSCSCFQASSTCSRARTSPKTCLDPMAFDLRSLELLFRRALRKDLTKAIVMLLAVPDGRADPGEQDMGRRTHDHAHATAVEASRHLAVSIFLSHQFETHSGSSLSSSGVL